MATYPANMVRACGIELTEKTKTAYMAIASIYEGTARWTLNGTDPMLPSPYDVKVQIQAYRNLFALIKKLKLDEFISEIEKAEFGDELTYPPPPISEASGYLTEVEHLTEVKPFNGGKNHEKTRHYYHEHLAYCDRTVSSLIRSRDRLDSDR